MKLAAQTLPAAASLPADCHADSAVLPAACLDTCVLMRSCQSLSRSLAASSPAVLPTCMAAGQQTAQLSQHSGHGGAWGFWGGGVAAGHRPQGAPHLATVGTPAVGQFCGHAWAVGQHHSAAESAQWSRHNRPTLGATAGASCSAGPAMRSALEDSTLGDTAGPPAVGLAS